MLPIIALAFATRLYHLDGQSLWFDEIVIVALARVPWYDGFVAALGQGIQLTPIFHGLVKLWLSIGDSDWLLRVPAVLAGVLTVPLVFKLGQFYFSDKVGLVAAFVFAINPYQVWYGQELKLYALLPLAAAGVMFAFCQMVQSGGRRGIGALIFFNLLGLPAHYFLFLISTVQFLYLLITLRRTYPLLRRWVLAQVIGVSPLLLWWLFIIQRQHYAVGVGWAPRPHWFDPLLTLWNFAYMYTGELSLITIAALAVMAVGLGLGLFQAWRRPVWGWLLILWLLFPIIVTVLMSFLSPISFYVDRYFLIITPVLTILTVAGLLSLPSLKLGWGLLLVFVALTAFGLWRVYFDRTLFSKEDWRTLAHRLDAQTQSTQMVITCLDGHRLSFEYYNPHHTLAGQDIVVASQVAEAPLSFYQTAWIIVTHHNASVHYLANTVLPSLDPTLLSPQAAIWQKRNLLDQIIVPGLSAYQYELVDPDPLAEVVAWHCRR